MSRKKKKSKIKVFFTVLISLIGVALLAAGLYINNLLGTMNFDDPADKTYELIPEETPNPDDTDPYATAPKEYSDAPKFSQKAPYDKNIINVLLIGADKRPDQKDYGRSDSMIIATLDKVHNKVKLTSIMRDTYVYIPGDYSDDRINSAYRHGYAPFLIETINANFNLQLKKYVVVDFDAFEKVIDKIGGIEIELNKVEVNYLKSEYGSVTKNLKVGVNKLNGRQALLYSRIRHVGNGDFERTDRQRKMMEAIFQKGLKTDLLTINSIMQEVLPMITTNLTKSEIVSLITSLVTGNKPVEQLRIPYDNMFTNKSIRGMAVLVPDIQANAAKIREFIYEDKG